VTLRTRFSFSIALLIASCLLLTSAVAEPPAMESQHFHPHADRMGWFNTESAQVLELWQPAFGVWGNYAHKPLVHYVDGEQRDIIVRHLASMNIQAAIGFGFADLAVDVPIHLTVAGDGLETWSDPVKGTLMGDIRIVPKFQFLDPVEQPSGFGLGIGLPLTLPSGDEKQYVGLETVAFTPQLLLSGYSGPFRLGGNLGYRVTKASDLGDLVAGNAFLFSVGLSVAPDPHVEITGEVFGDIRTNPLDNMRNNPIEWLAGLTIRPVEGLSLIFAGGTAIERGFSAPAARGIFCLGFAPIPRKDTDGDEIWDRDDECPEQPEDYDGFEDVEGCPDPDNDRDGILDVNDACPDVPENFNDWEDDDGCPEEIPDTDGDGLLDIVDQCIEDPEDVDTFEDRDGCPDPDNDQDKILDVDDQCPLMPETPNGYMDEDGCPEEIPDTDGDGYLDTEDGCPLDAEDFDEFEDENGCPDLDNDRDKILDVDDKCPLEPEVYNNVEDEDGCPDEGRVKITNKEIVILEKVYFDTGKSTIKAKSEPLLEDVAYILNMFPYIKLVEVQGHTDDVGSESSNQKLSDARAGAVKEFLTAQGVAETRLLAIGYGETTPLVPEKTSAARAENRRVQFIILEQILEEWHEPGADGKKVDPPATPTDATPAAATPAVDPAAEDPPGPKGPSAAPGTPEEGASEGETTPDAKEEDKATEEETPHKW